MRKSLTSYIFLVFNNCSSNLVIIIIIIIIIITIAKESPSRGREGDEVAAL